MLDGLQVLAHKAGVPMQRVAMVVHGTTLATNALIERSGARTGLLTTEGFRDVLDNKEVVLLRAIDCLCKICTSKP